MNYHIENAYQNGKYRLPFQLEGLNINNLFQLKEILINQYITAYSISKNSTTRTSYGFYLFFDNDYVLEFSSAITMTIGWQEVNSLNISIKNTNDNSYYENPIFEKNTITNFLVKNIRYYFYEDDDVYTEAGLSFSNSFNKIDIFCGISPGSISIDSFFSTEPVQPEFHLKDYKKIEIF
jgi:hypothetical protein